MQNAVNNTPCSMEKNVVVHLADWGNLGLHRSCAECVVPENNHTPPRRVFLV